MTMTESEMVVILSKQDEQIEIIESWIKANPVKLIPGTFNIVNQNRKPLATVQGWIVDGIFGIAKRHFSSKAKDYFYDVTHIPTGGLAGGGFRSKQAAKRFVQGIAKLGDWDSTNPRFIHQHKDFAPVVVTIKHYIQDGTPRNEYHAELAVRYISERKAVK